MKNQKGFSLIELLIVVVIIGIIAAIAIPNLLAARRSANEGSATASLRTLHGANMTYFATHGNGSFVGLVGATGDSASMIELSSVSLIDNVLGSGQKSGYNFVAARLDATSTAPALFMFSANPVTSTGVTQTGSRRFCVETPGVMRVDAAPATLGTAFTGFAAGTPPTAGTCNAATPTAG